MKTTKRKYVRKTKVEGNYTAKIKVLNRVYTAIASSPLEVLKALQVGKTAKGLSVIEVSREGGRSKSVVLPHVKTARLFSAHPMTREVALKNTSLFFDNL